MISATQKEIIYAKDWSDITAKQQENRLNLISKTLRSLSDNKWVKIDGDGRYGKPNDYTITSRRTPIAKTQNVVKEQPVAGVQGQASKPIQLTIPSKPKEKSTLDLSSWYLNHQNKFLLVGCQ